MKLYTLIIFMNSLCHTLYASNTGSYKIAMLGEKIVSLDPAKVREYNEITILSQICGKLTSIDEDLNIEGDLAQSWTISKDQKIFVFNLNRDRYFHNNSRLKAQDVVFTVKRLMATSGANAPTWTSNIARITALDINTVEIQLNEGNPRILYQLADSMFCILNEENPFTRVNHIYVPNSPSSYFITKIDNSKISLSVTKDYKDKAIEKNIEIQFMTQNEALSDFRNGHLHDISFYLLEPNEISEFKDKARILRPSLTLWTWVLALNPGSRFFSKKDFRKNFSKHFDRSNAISHWGDSIFMSRSLIPKGMRGYSEYRPKEFDLEKGAFPSPCSRSLKVILIEGVPSQKKTGENISREITRITGCEVIIQNLKMGEFLSSYQRSNADAYFYGIDSNTIDPLGFYRYFIKNQPENFLGYDDSPLNNEYSSLIRKQLHQRTPLEYENLQILFAQSSYAIVVGHHSFDYLYSKDVAHAHMNPLGMHLNRWWKIGRK